MKPRLVYTYSDRGDGGEIFARLTFGHWPLVAGLPLNIFIKIGQVRND